MATCCRTWSIAGGLVTAGTDDPCLLWRHRQRRCGSYSIPIPTASAFAHRYLLERSYQPLEAAGVLNCLEYN